MEIITPIYVGFRKKHRKYLQKCGKIFDKTILKCNKILEFFVESTIENEYENFFCIVPLLSSLSQHIFTVLFDGPDCNSRTFKTALTGELQEATVLNLMRALDHHILQNVIDFCGNAAAVPEEQMACLKDLSSESSFELDEISQKILLHIGESFTSLDEFTAIYDKEKKNCLEYYSYGGMGYCIRYTGRECWDEKATVAVISHFFSTGSNYQDREYLTPPDEEGTVYCIKEWHRGTTFNRYQPAIIRVFKK